MPTGISLPKIGASPDTNIEVNSVPETTVPAGSTVDFRLEDSVGNTVVPTSITTVGTVITAEVPAGGGGVPVGATLMQTGQTTSYRTGDDADTRAEGRAVDFFTLASNNPFGNTDRFTDELGGQTYTNDIVIDWSTFDGTTVLGWYRLRGTYFDLVWDDAIDNSLLFTQGTFLTGWRLPNFMELLSLINCNASLPYNYAPFNFNATGIAFWSSTTDPSNASNALHFRNAWNGVSNTRIKSNTSISYRAMPCRTFTWNGNNLI
jgi:hypothetical protein